jgi:hypothetical protein
MRNSSSVTFGPLTLPSPKNSSVRIKRSPNLQVKTPSPAAKTAGAQILMPTQTQSSRRLIRQACMVPSRVTKSVAAVVIRLPDAPWNHRTLTQLMHASALQSTAQCTAGVPISCGLVQGPNSSV